MIDIDSHLRPPRNYDRFIGILEQLYKHNRVPSGDHPLLRLRKCTLQRLVEESRPSVTVAFTTVGKLATMKHACSQIVGVDVPVVLIGGFAHSHFEQSTVQLADHIFSIDKEMLDAWIVAGRLIYEYECGTHLPERRVQL